MKGYITKNFQWEEFEFSNRAAELEIDNTIPDDTVAENIRALVFEILQPLRDACGHPLIPGAKPQISTKTTRSRLLGSFFTSDSPSTS